LFDLVSRLDVFFYFCPLNFGKMKKTRAAVVGYGNVGRFALEALEAAPDFEVERIVRRNANQTI
jgi:tRNA A37 threonylcarbamoyladenosine dehydratase